MKTNLFSAIPLLILTLSAFLWPSCSSEDPPIKYTAQKQSVRVEKSDNQTIANYTPKKDPAKLVDIIIQLDKLIAAQSDFDFLVQRYEEDKKIRTMAMLGGEAPTPSFIKTVGAKEEPTAIPEDSLKIYHRRFEVAFGEMQEIPSMLEKLGYDHRDPNMSRLTEVRKLMYRRKQLKLQIAKVEKEKKNGEWQVTPSDLLIYYNTIIHQLQLEVAHIDSDLINERYAKM